MFGSLKTSTDTSSEKKDAPSSQSRLSPAVPTGLYPVASTLNLFGVKPPASAATTPSSQSWFAHSL